MRPDSLSAVGPLWPGTPVAPASGAARRAGVARRAGIGVDTDRATASADGTAPAGDLRFDGAVADAGYRWWYVDAVSDDGEASLTLIAFLGSVFSTYYAIDRWRGYTDPLRHCAFNVSLWEPEGYHWAFTERGRAGVRRNASELRIGASGMAWDGARFTAHIDEPTLPFGRRLRGRLTLTPSALTTRCFLLDGQGGHSWWPIAPHARVEVEFTRPNIRFTGNAYLDSNSGHVPLEDTFASWTWSRAHLAERTAVFYDIVRRSDGPLSLALVVNADGSMAELEAPPPPATLQRTRWRLERSTRADAGERPRLVRTIEDGPFYARSLLDTRLGGQQAVVMQETLSLDRLRTPWSRWCVPYRNPRLPSG